MPLMTKKAASVVPKPAAEKAAQENDIVKQQRKAAEVRALLKKK